MSAEVAFPLPPPTATTPQLSQWGTQLATTLRRLQANGAFKGADEADLTAITAKLTALETQISSLLESLENGSFETLTAQQKFILSLVSAVDAIFGSFAEYNKTAFDWAQKAAAGGVEALAKGHIDRGFGRTVVINEQLTRQTETFALSQSLIAVNAAIGQTNANVTSLQQAYVTADAALAQSITGVQTSVAGNTSSINQIMSSVDGIKSRWGVSVTAQDYVQGLVQLDGTASGSTFTIIADKMQYAQPGVSGGDPIQVLAIANVNGAPKIAFRADMIGDGAITARSISVGSLSAITADIGTVTAGKIRDASATYELRIGDGWFGRVDKKSFLDLKNNVFQMSA